MGRHPVNPQYNRPFRSREGVFFGVCRGVAEYFDMPVNGVRLATVMIFFLTGFWPLIIGYCIAALLLKPEPVIKFESPDDAEFYSSYTTSPPLSLYRLKLTTLLQLVIRSSASVVGTPATWVA